MLNSPLLRNALKIGIAVFLTAAIAIWCERVTYVWYSLMAVVFVVDDNDAQTMQAAMARLLGTITGGLITFLVHTILDGWIGVMVSFLLMLPVLRLAGWQSASGVATLVSVMFLMIPSHAELNWDYVFNRGLDTLLGSVVALVVGLMLWPRNQTARLEAIPQAIRHQMGAQVVAYQRWLAGLGPRPEPLAPAQLTAQLVEFETLLQQELQGPQGRRLVRQYWPQRQLLWQHLHHHWIQWERLLVLLPDPWPLASGVVPAVDSPGNGSPGPVSHGFDAAGLDPMAASLAHLALALQGVLTPTSHGISHPLAAGPGRRGVGPVSDATAWRQLAPALAQPQVLLLAIGEELRPLVASLHSLNLIQARALASARAASTPQQPLAPSRRRGVAPALQQPGPPAPC